MLCVSNVRSQERPIPQAIGISGENRSPQGFFAGSLGMFACFLLVRYQQEPCATASILPIQSLTWCDMPPLVAYSQFSCGFSTSSRSTGRYVLRRQQGQRRRDVAQTNRNPMIGSAVSLLGELGFTSATFAPSRYLNLSPRKKEKYDDVRSRFRKYLRSATDTSRVRACRYDQVTSVTPTINHTLHRFCCDIPTCFGSG